MNISLSLSDSSSRICGIQLEPWVNELLAEFSNASILDDSLMEIGSDRRDAFSDFNTLCFPFCDDIKDLKPANPEPSELLR